MAEEPTKVQPTEVEPTEDNPAEAKPSGYAQWVSILIINSSKEGHIRVQNAKLLSYVPNQSFKLSSSHNYILTWLLGVNFTNGTISMMKFPPATLIGPKSMQANKVESAQAGGTIQLLGPKGR